MSKKLTVLNAQLLAKVGLLTQRHEDVDIRRYHPHPAVCGQACSHHLQHTLPATPRQAHTSVRLQPRAKDSQPMCVCYLSLWGALCIRTHKVVKALRASFSMCEPTLLPTPPSHSCNRECSKAFWEHRATPQSYGSRRAALTSGGLHSHSC